MKFWQSFSLIRVLDIPTAQQLKLNKTYWITSRTPNGSTPLHWTCYFNNLDMARYSLEQGTEPSIVSSRWGTALHVAIVRKAELVATYLVETFNSFDGIGDQGQSVLHVAVLFGSYHLISTLLRKGCSPIMRDEG
jgi:ankyrin repeat protein